MSEVDIAKAWGMSTTEYRALNSIARAEKKAGDISRASRMKDAGLPNTEIGRRMGLNESSVRELLKPNASFRKDEITRVKDILVDEVKQKKFIEYGLGVEQNLQCSSTSLKTAVEALKAQGYTTPTSRASKPTAVTTPFSRFLPHPGPKPPKFMPTRGRTPPPVAVVAERAKSPPVSRPVSL